MGRAVRVAIMVSSQVFVSGLLPVFLVKLTALLGLREPDPLAAWGLFFGVTWLTNAALGHLILWGAEITQWDRVLIILLESCALTYGMIYVVAMTAWSTNCADGGMCMPGDH